MKTIEIYRKGYSINNIIIQKNKALVNVAFKMFTNISNKIDEGLKN